MVPTLPLLTVFPSSRGGAIEVLVGVLFVALTGGWLVRDGVRGLHRHWTLARRGSRAPGDVLAVRPTGGCTLLEQPLLIFTTPEKPVVALSPEASLPGLFRPGRAVTVLYDPNNPNDACVASRGFLWGQPLLALVLGIGYLTLFFGYILRPWLVP